MKITSLKVFPHICSAFPLLRSRRRLFPLSFRAEIMCLVQSGSLGQDSPHPDGRSIHLHHEVERWVRNLEDGSGSEPLLEGPKGRVQTNGLFTLVRLVSGTATEL